jgi:hypothetical protein
LRVRDALAAGDPDGRLADDLDEAHLRRCARCAERRREFVLIRAELASLRTELDVPPADAIEALHGLLGVAHGRAEVRRRGWRVVAVGGIAAAATAGAAGAVVVQSLHRRARLAG